MQAAQLRAGAPVPCYRASHSWQQQLLVHPRGLAFTGARPTARWWDRRQRARHSAAYSASDSSSSSPGAVDEAAVQRLVQRALEIAAQYRRGLYKQHSVAAKMRAFLAAGWTAAEVERCLKACKGPPVGAEEHLAGNLQLLAAWGFTPAQLAQCFTRNRDFLSGETANKAAALEWLRTHLRLKNRSAVVAVVCREPSLAFYSTAALDTRLAWWRETLARSPDHLGPMMRVLSKYSTLLKLTPDLLSAKLAALAAHLGVEQSKLYGSLRANPHVLTTDLQGALLPRVDFLAGLLLGEGAADAAVRKLHRSLSTTLVVLKLSEGNLEATFATVAELLGSKAAAQDVLRRNLTVLAFGRRNVRRNWDVLLGLLGGSQEAAAQAVRRYPGLLRMDLSRAVFQQRLRFYQQECGVGTERVLNSYLDCSLIRVAPRVAWVKRHKPLSQIGRSLPGPFTRPDAECMERCGVPLEGYAEFKQEWLASAEGREWCRHEQGKAAKALAAEQAEREGSVEEEGSGE